MNYLSDNENVTTKCGFIAIIGRANVGKSSLLNAILGKKVSIISFRPQTTRHQILGIKTQENSQTIYVDTPGLQLGARGALNRQMNKVAHQSLVDVNTVIFVVDVTKWTDEDDYVCQIVENVTCPVIVALNKIDLIARKEDMLKLVEKISKILPKAQIIPISVKRQIQLDVVEEMGNKHLPLSPFYFPADQTINHSEQFYSAEIVREKIMCLLDKELPYAVCVQIETLTHEDTIVRINALIWVEREGQKRIIIGDKGSMLKDIGTQARLDLERYYNKKVCLKLWVKVNESWSTNTQSIQNLAYQFQT